MTDRKVSLELAAKTTGLDDLKRVADELKEIAKAGGEAAPEAQRLLDNLEKLADKQKTASATQDLKDEYLGLQRELTNVSQRLNRANKNLDEHAAALKKAQKANEDVKAKVHDARMEVDAAAVAYYNAKQAIVDLEARYESHQDMLIKNRMEYHRLTESIKNAADAEEVARIKLRTLNAEYRETRKELSEVEKAYDKVSRKQKTESKLYDKAVAAKSDKKAEIDTNLTSLSAYGVTGNSSSIANAASLGDLKLAVAEAEKFKNTLYGVNTAAELAKQGVDKAFSIAGVRTAQQIRDEIQGIEQAMLALANTPSITSGQFEKSSKDSAERIKQLRAELDGVDLSAKATKRTFNDMAVDFAKGAILSEVLFGAMGAMQGAATQAVTTAAAMETLQRGMSAVFGGQANAAKELEYVRAVSDRTGVSLIDLGKAYSKVALSAREAGFSQAQAREVFEAVSGAMGVLGESSSETGFALQAITQMLSKGVVSMEEFRQQLAERLPGAFEATARELGLTTAELNAFIATGKATAFDVLPALASGLNKVYPTKAQNDTLAGGWERFLNGLRMAANELGESGALQMGFKGVRIAAGAVYASVGTVIESIRALGTLSAGVVAGDLSGALSKVGDDFKKMDANAKAIAGTLDDTQKTAGKTAESIGALGISVKDASPGFIRLMVDLKNAEDNASAQATAMRKAAEYTRSSGEASATAAANLATETEQRRIATQIAERNVAALRSVLAAETEVLSIKEKGLAALTELAAKSEDEAKRRKDSIEKVSNEINTQRELVEGLKLQVRETENLRIARQVDAEALKYNGDKVAQYRQVLTAALLTLQAVNQEYEQGPVAIGKLIDAQNAIAASTKLYADALQDQIDKRKAEMGLNDANTSMLSAVNRLKQEQYRTTYELAKANGDENAATFALVQIKRLEAELTRLNAEAKRAEAQATLQLVTLQREELRVKNDLTPAKELELKMQEKKMEVAIKEADIQMEIAKRTERLTYVTQNQTVTTSEAAKAQSNLAGEYSRIADEADSAAESVDRLNTAQRATRSGTGKMSDAQAIDYETIARQKGLTGDAVKRFTEAMTQTMAEEQAIMTENLKRFNGTMEASTYQEYVRGANNRAIQRAYDMANQGQQQPANTEVATAHQQGQNTTPEGIRFVKRPFDNQTQQAATSHNVTVVLGGRKTNISVASPTDATKVVSLLRAIQNDSERV